MVNILKNFKKEEFILKNHPTFLVPLFAFVILQEIFSRIGGKKSQESLEHIGGNFGQQLAIFLRKKYKRKSSMEIYSAMLMQLSFLGLGEFNVIRKLKNKCIVIKNSFNPLAAQYKKSFGIQGKGIDFFTLGILKGSFSEIFQCDAEGTEVACAACNKPHCVYEIKWISNKKIIFEIPLDLDKLDVSHEFSYNHLIKRILKSGQCSLMNGQLKIWNISCLNLPFPLIELFAIEAGKNSNEAEHVVDFLCDIQTQVAVSFQRDKFGIKERGKLLNNLFGQQEMILGLFGKIKLEKNAMIIELNRCIPFDQFIKLNGTDKNFKAPYTMALVRNLAIRVLNKDVKHIGLRVMQNELREIRALLTERIKMKRTIIKKEYENVIIEKTKHKYFLS